MKKELIGIIVCMLLIITVLPASGNNLEKTSDNIPNLIVSIRESKPINDDYGGGCYVLIGNSGDVNVTINFSFNVFSYSLKGEYLGKSEITRKNIIVDPVPFRYWSYHMIPDYYGELFTLVYVTIDIENVDNSEQTESKFKFGISIGKWIRFHPVLHFIVNIINFLFRFI